MSAFVIAGGALAVGVAASFAWRLLKPRPEVTGKTVFITGGSEGIGKSLALEFVKRGANVVIMARTESKLQSAVKDLEAAKVRDAQKIGLQKMDVTDMSSVKEGISSASAAFGSPAFLIACAGVSKPGYFLEQDASVAQQQMDLNYMGTVNVLKVVAPVMKAQGGGHIMIVASAAAVVSFIGYSSYSPTKFALRGLADSLRNELIGFGIKVSICYPPDTDTPGFAEEEKLKPAETKACFPASPYSSESVARGSIHSMLAGDYHIQSVDILQNLLVTSMAGVTPRSFPILEILLQPILCLVYVPFLWNFDYQARCYAKRVLAEEFRLPGQKLCKEGAR